MEALSHFTQNIGSYDFPIVMFLLQAFFALFVLVSIILFIYDRFIQRENQLLINYPLGVRHSDGSFDEERYQKTMKFAKMTEIKMAQGAKQTGEKLLGSKVSKAIAYYRGVEAHKDLFSPNQFPFAHNLEELFDFMGRVKKLSEKPVEVKIVISSQEGFSEYAELIKKRLDAGSSAYPDFITIDGGDGGSGAAPLEMMMTVGMTIEKALYIADTTLKSVGVREKV